jgi:hypothetical protein
MDIDVRFTQAQWLAILAAIDARLLDGTDEPHTSVLIRARERIKAARDTAKTRRRKAA